MAAGVDGPDADVEGVRALVATGHIEEAARLAAKVADRRGLADAVADARSRAGFLDVDIALVRLIEDVLERVPRDDRARRARLAAKLAFELRGDPATISRRQDLLVRAGEDAAASGDDAAQCAVMLGKVSALWEPSGAADRLSAADAAIGLARRTGDLDREMEARVGRIHSLVELGRVQEAQLEVATYARLAEPLDRRDLDAFVASRRAMLALIDGRIDDALRFGENAYAAATAAGMPDAERLGMTYRAAVAQDRTGQDMDAVLEGSAAMFLDAAVRLPGQYFEADAAYVLLILGRRDDARAELARAMPSLLTSYGHRWHFAASNAAFVAAAVGSERDCDRLYAALLPHQGTFVVLGSLFWGSMKHRLGALALRLGRVRDAVTHLRAAVRELDDVAALPWTARARLDLARALRAAGSVADAVEEGAAARETMHALGMSRPLADLDHAGGDAATTWSLVRDGSDWLLEAGTERVRLPRSRGFDHLRTLLANPGRDLAAFDLDAGETRFAPTSGIEVLDDRAKSGYRRRLAEIDAELDASDEGGDQVRAAALADEREQILAELRRATGLGGRDRRTNDVTERARVNVTRNLKRSIEQVARVAPMAAQHLAASIRTGTYCRYDPAPGGPQSWRV
jgi:tetratricopeptide (TPR) repeat protein